MDDEFGDAPVLAELTFDDHEAQNPDDLLFRYLNEPAGVNCIVALPKAKLRERRDAYPLVVHGATVRAISQEEFDRLRVEGVSGADWLEEVERVRTRPEIP